MTQILCKSNAKFFGNTFGIKDIYGNELDPFNVRGSSMLSGKFEQFTTGNQNIEDGLKVTMAQPSNCSFNFINMIDNKDETNNMVNTNNQTSNMMQGNVSLVFNMGNSNVPTQTTSIGMKQEEPKKNLLGMYNQLKKQQQEEH